MTGKHSNSPNVVGVHYKVGNKIGEGSFGVIYEGVNLLNHNPIAVKFESRKSEAPQLRDEFRTYKILSGTVGIPNVYYYGQEGLHNILCIDLLGPSLEDMFDLCGRKFSIKTVCMAAKQMITRIQSIHEKNLIYRDIKPDNFLTGRIIKTPDGLSHDILDLHSPEQPHPASRVYIVDFGMAKQYRDPKTKQHIPYREKKSLSGTARYMSINTHLGREQSRRDDLEALGHVFMYFLRGSLPWQGLKAATNKQKYEKIGEKKQSTSVKDLCEQFPEEFGQYLAYVRGLKFDEQPDYDFLRTLFNKVLQRYNYTDDGVFDWMVVMSKQYRDRERQREEERITKELGAQAQAQNSLPMTNLTVHSFNQISNDTSQGQSPQIYGTSVFGLAGSTHANGSPMDNYGSLEGRRPSNLSLKQQHQQQAMYQQQYRSSGHMVNQGYSADAINVSNSTNVGSNKHNSKRVKPQSQQYIHQQQTQQQGQQGQKKTKTKWWMFCCGSAD